MRANYFDKFGGPSEKGGEGGRTFQHAPQNKTFELLNIENSSSSFRARSCS